MIDAALFDIDGVLTDGKVYISAEGAESKQISFDDIDAIFELKRSGVKIGFITGEDTPFALYVNKRFSPDYFISGCKDKLSYFKNMEGTSGLSRATTCFVGDSKKDIELLRHVEFSFAPDDVDPLVKQSARLITRAKRGQGVIKEVAAFILRERNSPELSDILPSWDSRVRDHIDVMTALREDPEIRAAIQTTVKIWIDTLRSGGKILICGNGGSAADAQHLATELVSRFFLERRALDAEALTVNTSTLTAVGNDYSFARVFSRQVEAKGRAGDVLLGISTSGNSENVVEAIRTAKAMGMITIGMTGENKDTAICHAADHCICVPSRSTPRVQEAHILIGHFICEMVEKNLFQG